MRRQYRLVDFLRKDEITISSAAQTTRHYPFTLYTARDFFRTFENSVFDFDSELEVRSIYIFSGKNALPRHSFASGYLLSVPLDTYEKYGLAGIPDPLGTITLECGGTMTSPCVRVQMVPTERPKRTPTSASDTAPLPERSNANGSWATAVGCLSVLVGMGGCLALGPFATQLGILSDKQFGFTYLFGPGFLVASLLLGWMIRRRLRGD